MMFVNDFVSEIFPTFKSLKFKASINSPSLCLHVKRVTTALENAAFSLNDAKVFIEYLMNLGERHKAWKISMYVFCYADQGYLGVNIVV